MLRFKDRWYVFFIIITIIFSKLKYGKENNCTCSRRVIDRLICSKTLGLFYEMKYVEGKKGNVNLFNPYIP